MSLDRTVKCPICGEPYKTYSHTVADQSACPDCVNKAEKKIRSKQLDTMDWRKIHA